MSICPVPATASVTDYTAPGSFTSTPPDPKYELCEGGTTSVITGPGTIVTQTICCPSPGPAGPRGCSIYFKDAWALSTAYNFESGVPDCATDTVTHNGVLYIAKAMHTSSADTEPGVGADWTDTWAVFGAGTVGAMVWTGDWAAGVAYKEDEVVRFYSDPNLPGYGNGYVCIADHTSSPTILPPDAAYWEPITDVGAAISEEDKSFLDGLVDSVFDWIKDAVDNGDWLTLLAAGIGVAVAGAAIVDMFTGDGQGDGNADSRYDGTPGYNGAFTAPNLQQVVTSIMTYGGYTGGQFDVTLLPTSPVNFTVAATTTLRNVLQQLSLTYQFDIVPSGGTVKFVPKYQASARTLAAVDLGHKVMGDSDVAGSVPYTMKRVQGIDLPRSVSLNYYSAEMDHNVFTQTSTLETFTEGQDVKLDVPFTLSNAEAKRIVETAMVNAHIEQQQVTFSTDYYNLDLEPGDVVTIPLDTGGTMDVRIIQVTSQDDGILEFTAVRADYNTTSYNASGVASVDVPAQTTNPVSVIGYSNSLFIEVPPLNDTETLPRIYAIIHGYGAAGWPGAALYRSVDSGASYTAIYGHSAISTMGLMDSVMPPPVADNYYVWDDDTTISVTLKQGTLGNATSDLAVQNGQNWCMIGEEVVGFRYAALIGTNQYLLSRLLRGRVGTEQKIGTHVVDELFVLLDPTLVPLPLDVADIGKTVKYKTVTYGSDLSKATAVDVKPYGLNMRPYAPAKLTATRNLTTNDWTLTWIERPRYNNGLRDYTELVHDADWAGYAVAIRNGMTIVRTATSVSPTFVWTAAMQVADFGSVQSSIDAQVVQMSTLVGGGYPSVIVV